MLAARSCALALLGEVLDRKKPLDQALDSDKALAALPSRDRAFVRMLVATALRRTGQIDDILRRAEARPGAPQPVILKNILRLGAAQLLFMETADHAAVDTSVRLAEQAQMDRQKGFVNALLRRVASEGKGWLDKQDPARLNMPEWMLREWIADYGMGEAAQIAMACLTEAPLDITVKKADMRDHWAKALEAEILPTGTLRRPAGGSVRDLQGFEDGMWWVQDAAAAIPATLFGPLEGRRVIDLCAAPGGKTAQLAAAGAQVLALDRSAQRLKRLEENIKRLRLHRSVETLAADAGEYRPKEPAEALLLDAPCTATGTIRRHPDVPHLKTAVDYEKLVEVQARLLEHAVSILAPGGTLIYCTCSLQKGEGERQIDRLLASGAPVRREPVRPEETGGLSDLITPEGDVRILPTHLAGSGGMDGFFASRLVRKF